MNLDKINYYGVSRADYQACQEQIDRHATTYLVFVVLVAVLLTDKFWTTGAFYLAMLLVLSFCSYYFKGPIMWELDSFNGLTFTLVALALNYIVQRERIASFLLFNKYKENQRELRVQANFDYLSGVILRSIFMDLSQKAIEQPECTDLFIGLVDIDYFKQINDNYGRRMGGWPFKG
ncbi:GGDEF domain-containing protein [Lactobacillus delbrueckii subsp. bulgaricus]